MSEEKAANDDNEAVDKRTELTKTRAGGGGFLGGPGYSTHPGMEGQLAGNNKTRPAVRQPMGECDGP
jgi:hypothetical protein